MEILDEIILLEKEIENYTRLKSDERIVNGELRRERDSLMLYNLKIKLEKQLSNMPCQAIGSINLYNKLNEKYKHFENNQFTKIIRFISHIEDKEKVYRQLYLNSTSNYFKDPERIPFQDLKATKKELDFSYSLLSILTNEVNGDLVAFNKVYNKLEDAGLFMSIPEKNNQEYLKQISNKLGFVMKSLKVIFKQLEESNQLLRSIDENIQDTSYALEDVNSYLWDISYYASQKK